MDPGEALQLIDQHGLANTALVLVAAALVTLAVLGYRDLRGQRDAAQRRADVAIEGWREQTSVNGKLTERLGDLENRLTDSLLRERGARR